MPAKKSAAPVAAPAPAAPIQPPTHTMTRKQWGESVSLQIELARVLDLPVMQMAFATLLHESMPNVSPKVDLVPGVSAEALALAANNLLYHRSGMTAVYRRLHSLAREQNVKPRGQDWGNLEKEDE